MTEAKDLPLAGIRVVEFTHMVMGPTCGIILGDLGAEVIKVEPLGGDNTRKLVGAGAGFFALFNRNKKSIAVDTKDPRGREIVLKLVAGADVFSENFKAGAMERLGFGYAALSQLNPRLVYVSHKGFLPGPYDHRTALDEVVQMMGGLAYMTGPIGRPLRAGSSVNDIMGGMFGAIGVLAALGARHKTGKGQEVQSALFENNVFLVAQHMMQAAVMGVPPAPMPSRISPWAVYDVFTVADDEQIFLAVVSDTQWAVFCEAFGFADLKADPRLANNSLRVANRDTMIPMLRERLADRSAAELARGVREGGPAVCADRPARGAVRRSAPARHRRPGAGDRAGRRQPRRPADRDPHRLAAADARRRAARPAPAAAGARPAHARAARASSATAPPRSRRCTPTAWSAPIRSRRRRRRSRPTPEAPRRSGKAARPPGRLEALEVAALAGRHGLEALPLRLEDALHLGALSRFSFSRSSSSRAARLASRARGRVALERPLREGRASRELADGLGDEAQRQVLDIEVRCCLHEQAVTRRDTAFRQAPAACRRRSARCASLGLLTSTPNVAEHGPDA